MEEDEIMDIDAIINDSTPLLWTRKLTTRLLNEFKLHAPKVGKTIKNMNVLHAVIARVLRNEFKCEITPNQVGNKLKSIKRKYQQYKEKGKSVVEFGPGLEEVVKIMDRLTYAKTKKSSLEVQTETAIQSIKTSNDETYSVEIVDESLQNQGEIMDINQFLSKREVDSSKSASATTCQDPLEGDVVIFDEKSRRGAGDKLNLLEKKIENQEKSLEERLRKNELIEERNRLIATLLTKKTKNDVIDAIRKDRLLHHQEMRELWAERLEVEKKKLQEKKRKNDLLEERNKLMKALIEENKKSGNDTSKNDEDSAPTVFLETVELE